MALWIRRRLFALFLPSFFCFGLISLAQDEVQLEPFSLVREGGVVDFAAGVEFWRGYSTYSIGGGIVLPDGSRQETWFPISELEFPLDAPVGTIQVTWRPGGRFEIGLGVKHNFLDDAGTMEDSDWLREPGSLDVYSESDAEIDLWVAEANARYVLYASRMVSLAAGLGYLYERFDYEISNVDQTYPSTDPSYHEYYAGLALLYEVTYHMPYIELAAQTRLGDRFRLEGRVAYSPFVSVEDEDKHLLRDKLSESEGDGDALFVSLLGRWDVNKDWFATAGLDYRVIYTDGDQAQYDSGQLLGWIENTIESEQLSLNLGLGRVF